MAFRRELRRAVRCAATPPSDDLRLPASIVRTDPSQEGVVVTISKTEVLLGDERVVRLPATRSQGAGAGQKLDPNGLYIVPLGEALKAARRIDKRLREQRRIDASFSEAVIVADRTTPYRLLCEVTFTLGQNEFGKYHLLVMQSR